MKLSSNKGWTIPICLPEKIINRMKITIVLCLLTTLCSFASVSYSQKAEISLNLNEVTLQEAINAVKEQSDFSFWYRNEEVNLQKKISVKAEKQNIKQIMAQILSGQDLTYTIDEKYIIIYKKYDQQSTQQQKKKISGIVTDENGDPLIGVNVVEKGTTNGSITDVQGAFTLTVSDDTKLQISYIGYTTIDIAVGNKSLLNITLAEDILGLEEVVIVGYGSVKKRDLTGSVASINAKKITAVPATTAAAALQGRIPGVLVSTTNWAPGQTPSVLIRGKRSITANNDPLYVVDGIPITGGMEEISPTDIESMEVLKDASATAIYGARGANGVILITTKSGQQGKTKIDYNGYYGWQTIQNEIPLMNGSEYAEYVREAYRNTTKDAQKYMSDTPNKEMDMLNGRFVTDPYVMESVLMGYDENGNYDPSRVRTNSWMDAVTRTGMITDHQLSVRGGNSKTNFLASATYNKNEGIFKDVDYERYSIRLNLNHEINKYVKFGVQTQYSHSTYNKGTDMANNWRITPLGSLYEKDGSITPMIGSDSQMWNPLLNLEPGAVDRPKKTSRYLGSYFLEIKLPVNGLKFRSNLGMDSRTVQDHEFYSAKSTARQLGTSKAKNRMEKYTMFTLENLLFYDKTFAKKHTLGITLLQSLQEDKGEWVNGEVENLPSDKLKYNDLGAGLNITNLSSQYTRWNMASFMGRINYNFMGKYLLTLSARYDGSSRLANGHKWVLFPSAALAWRLSDETFFKNINMLDNLKLRVGYGKTGNSAVDPYQTMGLLKMAQYVYNNGATEAIGYAPSLMANPLLTWETTAQWNLGLDFGFFKNRISGSLDLYLQNTSDLLLNRQLPVVSGFDKVLSNVGKTRNKGIELTLTTNNIVNKNFQWSTDWVVYSNKEEIVSLYNGKVDDIGSKWFIGHPVDTYYDYKKIGIWQNTPEDLAEMEKFNVNGSSFKPGMIKLQDNGDYKINSDDRVIIGDPRPKVIMSMVNNLAFKNFDFSIFLYASLGSMIYNDYLALSQPGRNNSRKVDYWTPNNPTNAFPRPSIDYNDAPYMTSCYYEKADFLRIRSMTLGYTIPENLSKKALIERVRFYFTAQNPFVWTNYSGIDPEGAKGSTTPSVSSWIIGINLSL